ncbi:L-lactate dehydrogenase (cytochrome) [Exophiala dermatitidis]
MKVTKIPGPEVAKHNTRQSCWIAVHGKVYDVTDFLDQHPGGANIILRCAGQDATKEYESVHSPELIAETLPPTAFQGVVDAETIPKSASQSRTTSKNKSKNDVPPLSSMISVNDFEAVAEETLTPNGWAYYASGADDEISKTEAARAFRKLTLRPRVLRKVDTVDTRTTILGQSCSMPIYVSPSGLAKYAHPDAECNFASGAGKEGIIQVIPTSPSMSIEKIIAARVSKKQPVFFQLYLNRDSEKAEALIRRVEALGVSAIWLTVDSPVLGKRERDDRLKAQEIISDQDQVAVLKEQQAGVAKVSSAGLLNPTLCWDHIAWIRRVTKLPLVLKGIQSVEDAVLAYEHGVEGIVLSNHGGRSQDTAQAPMITLLEIRRYAPFLINSKMEIFVDGGIRRGTDVLKALALGARAVGLGRPFLYSLTGGYGEAGFRRMVQILREELEGNMALAGASQIREIKAEMVNTKRLEKEVIGSVKL